MAQGGIKDTTLINDANLLSYFKLEDTTDTKGAHTLTNNGASFVTALINNGADLGASNVANYLVNSTDYGISGGNYSCSFWLKLKTEVTAGEYDLVSCGKNAAGNADYRMIYVFNGGTIQLRWVRAGSATNEVDYTISLGTTNWYFIVGTYDGTNLKLYVNNVQQGGSVAASGTSTPGYTGLYIGRDHSADSWASAIFDDIGIWSKALSSGEVNTLYTATAAVASSALFFMQP